MQIIPSMKQASTLPRIEREGREQCARELKTRTGMELMAEHLPSLCKA